MEAKIPDKLISKGKMMLKRIAQLCIVLMAFVLFGCGVLRKGITGGEPLPEQSVFKASYSIGSIVENHKELLIEGSRTLSGSEVGPRTPFVQNQEVMVFQIHPDNASQLMESIQSDIAEMLNSTATITGTSGFDGRADPIAFLSYSYRADSFYGVVDVWGIRGEGDQFILISQVTESINSGR